MFFTQSLKLPSSITRCSKLTISTARWFNTTAALPCNRCVPPEAQVATPKTTYKPQIPQPDHREIGRSLDLFSLTNYSPGSPLLHANGSHIFLKLQEFLRAQYDAYGFEEVVSPTIYKKSLWQVSGHWDNYKDDMFEVSGRGASGMAGNVQIGEDEQYGLKPMNCPGHCLIYKSQRRSYRDLPIRYADFSPLHRNEISGSLSGLTRVRRFHQDDGHIFCTLDQVKAEITDQLKMVDSVYSALGFQEFKLVLSTRPQTQYIGEIVEWDGAERQLKDALSTTGRTWELSAGDGAFYGPKIDIILKDSHGKEHQTATIQLDFQLPQRFDLTYQAPSPQSTSSGELTNVKGNNDSATQHSPSSSCMSRPVIIHRAILGSFERFMALLLEHTKGRLPFWLSPRQLNILTTTTDADLVTYAEKFASSLSGRTEEKRARLVPISQRRRHFKVQTDSTAEKVGRKVRNSKTERWCVTAIAGPEEMRDAKLAVDLSGFVGADEERVRAKVEEVTRRHKGQDWNWKQVKMKRDEVQQLMCWMEDNFI